MLHVDSNVPLVTDRPTNTTTAATALRPGDVLAVPFAGYADILCEVTEVLDVEDGDTIIELTVFDGTMSYTHQVSREGSVLTYPRERRGEVRS